MRTRTGPVALALFLLLFAQIATANPQDVETRVDATDVPWGQSVTLHIRLRGSLVDSQLDVTPLSGSFEILDVGRSQRLSVIDGQYDSSTDWTIALLPKSTGSVEIPALDVGSERTEALSLNVIASSNALPSDERDIATAPAEPAFVRVRAERRDPYEQERLLLHVRLYAGPEVIEGVLHDPDIEGTTAERVGEDRSFHTEIDGRSYRGVERTYALVPDAPGKLVVPPVTFEGVVRDERPAPSRRRFGAFGPSLIDEFFSNRGLGGDLFDRLIDRDRRRLLVRSEPLALDVRPRPEASQDDWWLPARDVSLSESWNQQTRSVRVGEALTRHITLRAEGASTVQLPPLSTPSADGVKQYAEAPKSSDDESGATRVQDITIIPTQPGRIELPPIEVAWWDTEADAPRVATLGARTIDVVGEPLAAATSAADEGGAPMAGEQAVGAIPATSEPTSASATPREGLSVAAIVLGCGLAGVLGWRLLAHRAPSPTRGTPSARAARRSLRRACRRSDPAAAEHALQQLLLAHDPGGARITGEQWARALGSEDLAHEVARLRNVRYSSTPEQWNGEPLWKAYRSAKKTRLARARRGPERDGSGLPPLYPDPSRAGATRGS